jgi:hypothetical protein
MPAKPAVKIYDPQSGRPTALEKLIVRLGIRSVAQKYGVTEATVRKWLKCEHRPARRTLLKSCKPLI